MEGSTSGGDLEANLKTSPEQTKEVPLRRLAYLNKPEIPVLLVGSVAAIVNGVILPIFGILFSSVIRTFYETPSKLRRDSRFWSLMFVAMAVAALLAAPARTYFFAVAGSRLIRRIRIMCFERAVHQEVGWFDSPQNTSGAVGARLSADAATVRSLVGDTLALVVENTASIVAGLAIAFEASWQLSLIIIAMLPLVGIFGWAQLKFLKGFSANAKVFALIFSLSLATITSLILCRQSTCHIIRRAEHSYKS